MILLTFIQKAIVQGIGILFGSIGEILTEKSGNLNLGIPGLMYMGGIAGLIGTFYYEKAAGAAAVPIICILIATICALIASFIMAAVSAFLVFLEKGAMQIASQYQLSDYISNVVKGIILIFMLGSEFFVNFKIRIRGSHKTEVTK